MDNGTCKKTQEQQKTLVICQRKSKVYEKVKHRKTRRTKPQLSPNRSCKKKKKMKQEAKSESLKNLKSTWEEKALHGQYPLQVNNFDVDQKKTHQWLRSWN